MKIKPVKCPHCLIAPETILHYAGWHIKSYSVACITGICAIQPHTEEFKTEKEAIEAWNQKYKNYP